MGSLVSLYRLPFAWASKRPWRWAVVLWFAVLGTLVLLAMLSLSFYYAREANRQKILTALDTGVSKVSGLAQVVEMAAQNAERVIASVDSDTSDGLRTALGTGVVALRQVPELSHFGIILPAGAGFGNLERAGDGTIRMWLHAGSSTLTQVWVLGETGFSAQTPPDPPLGQSAPQIDSLALQHSPDGVWELRQHPWMVHDAAGNTAWGVSYTKALRDDTGRMLGVLDANFDLSEVHAYVNAMRATYGIQLDMIVLGESPVVITDGTRAPQPVPAAWEPLLHFPGNAFSDTMTLHGERHWVAARAVTFHGGIPVLFVASRPVSWFATLIGSLHWSLLAAALLVLGSAGLAWRRMAQHVRPDAAAQANLEYLATHDDLTGLPKQALMQQRIDVAMEEARTRGAQLALLYLDLDRFQSVNDNYGARFSNSALQKTAATLVALVRPADTVAYLGTDKFMILLTEVAHANAASQLARTIMDTLRHGVVVQERALVLRVSIGISLFPQHGDTPDSLIHNADLAMREVKHHGRDALCVYTEAIGAQSRARVGLEKHLSNALKDGQLHLVYQPKISLDSGTVVGCEALLRWTHPELGEVAPYQFIPIAEETGLILPIGDWVLETACRQARAWLDAGVAPVRVAVNLSIGQFLRRDVVAWVVDTLERTRLPAECLQLELTESLSPQNLEVTIDTFQRLKDLGVLLALDDFGTGYSNLSHLKRFPIHTLKIDQSFVRQAITSPKDAAIVRAVITLAHRLNFRAVAEGVETEAQVQFLRQEQCDEIQGFYCSRPLAPEAYAQCSRQSHFL